MASGVYQIVNKVNGKRYIGSSNNIKQRWAAHKSQLRSGSHFNPHLQNSWKKYGEKNFRFDVICECQVDDLSKYEQFFLDARMPEYNVARYAYNSMLGVEFSIDHKRKISEGLTGRKLTKEHRMNVSKNHHDVSGKNNPMYGKRFSEDHRQKISEALSGNIPYNKGKRTSDEARKNISKYHADISRENHPNWIEFSDDDIERMVKMKLSGCSYAEIASIFNVSKQVVRDRIVSTGKIEIKTRSKQTCKKISESLRTPIADHDLKEMVELRKSGYSYLKIGERFGLSYTVIRSRLMEMM